MYFGFFCFFERRSPFHRIHTFIINFITTKTGRLENFMYLTLAEIFDYLVAISSREKEL